jgi:hypothetical protein
MPPGERSIEPRTIPMITTMPIVSVCPPLHRTNATVVTESVQGGNAFA